MPYEDIQALIKKYQEGNATEDEIALIESWYLHHNEDEKQSLTHEELMADTAEIWEKLHEKKSSSRMVWLWSAAAAAVCFLFIGYLFLDRVAVKKVQKNTTAAIHQPNDKIVPGTNKAVLTLANGEKVILEGEKSNNVIAQGNASIKKAANGKLVYVVNATNNHTEKIVYNTVTTPAGGQYWVVLSDGTRVFLNAGSSLRFPASFAGNERKVELKGEAYFEVVHNAAAPFRIATPQQVIEDIGTTFNVSAYDDEPLLKTTLVEGAVKVTTSAGQVFLKPGQQAQVNRDAVGKGIKLVSPVDIDEVLAWKNGLFQFNKADLKQVMNAASRWYNFKVNYEHKIPSLKISGRISRNVDFSGFIALLEFEGVKFDINGRNVTIKN